MEVVEDVLEFLDLNAGLSPSKKNCFICFNENPLKMMKNGFYFTLKALFVLKIFKISYWLSSHVEKKAHDRKHIINFKVHDVKSFI